MWRVHRTSPRLNQVVDLGLFLPQARAVTLIDDHGKPVAEFERIDPEGLFVAHLKGSPFPYRLRVNDAEIEDPYRFPPLLGAMDFHLIAEGNHLEPDLRFGRRYLEAIREELRG